MWPSYTEQLEYECEIAAVVGRGGRDLAPAAAHEHVFGYTIMNDWSARDVQKDEMSCWLGPAKAKDFATTLGPWLVTPEEWSPEEPHRMEVRVDGELWSDGGAALDVRRDAGVGVAGRGRVRRTSSAAGPSTAAAAWTSTGGCPRPARSSCGWRGWGCSPTA